MIAWEAIPYVGTGLSLVAFIVAAFLFAYKARLENSARNIESAPAADRLEAIAAMAEFFRVDLRNLRPEEQKEIVLAQIKHRGRRDLMSGIVAIIVAALLAAVTIIAIESSSVNGGGSGQDQNAEEISIARKNMAQVRSPLVQMGSSQGYRAGNKRQTLTFLQGIDTSSDVDLRAKVAYAISLAENAPENNSDGDFYDIRVLNELQFAIEDAIAYIERKAAALGISDMRN